MNRITSLTHELLLKSHSLFKNIHEPFMNMFMITCPTLNLHSQNTYSQNVIYAIASSVLRIPAGASASIM